MFKGRVLSIPYHIEGETLTLLLIAEPSNAQGLLATLHEALKTEPLWDPLFIKEEDHNNPLESLEARSALHYWSRLTNQVSLSDYFWGREKK